MRAGAFPACHENSPPALHPRCRLSDLHFLSQQRDTLPGGGVSRPSGKYLGLAVGNASHGEAGAGGQARARASQISNILGFADSLISGSSPSMT